MILVWPFILFRKYSFLHRIDNQLSPTGVHFFAKMGQTCPKPWYNPTKKHPDDDSAKLSVHTEYRRSHFIAIFVLSLENNQHKKSI
jgi:hypothetical protein